MSDFAVHVPSVIHVLIVDDHPVNRQVVSMYLDALGWRWTAADDGQEAVRLARVQAFDLILMDMMMPQLDGVTATKRIRLLDGPNQATPVIALTANGQACHAAEWARIGVSDFLTKPVDPERLIHLLLDRLATKVDARSVRAS